MPKWGDLRHALEEYEEERYYDEQDDGTDDQKQLLSYVRAHNLSQVRRIVARGINLNFCDHFGETLLHIVANLKSSPEVLETVELLIYFGAPVERCDRFGQTPLHIASEESADIVRLLLDAGSPVNVQDNAGRTALMLACINLGSESLTIVQYLLDRGANVSLRDKDNQTALHYACSKTVDDVAVRNEIVYKMLYAGIPVDQLDVSGTSAMHQELVRLIASDIDDSATHQLQVFKTLLRGGADCIRPIIELRTFIIFTRKQYRLCITMLKIAEPLIDTVLMMNLFKVIYHMKRFLEAPNSDVDAVYNYLHTSVRSVRSLKALSRIAVRNSLSGCILPNIEKLGLPVTLGQYVTFQEAL